MIDRFEILAAAVAVSCVVWMLARQRGLSRRFFVGYPFLGAALEAALYLATAYSASVLLVLVARMPMLVEWHSAAKITSELFVYLGFATAFARLAEGWLHKSRSERNDWRLTNLARLAFYGLFLLIGGVCYMVTNGRTPTEFLVWTGATAAVLAFIMQQTLGDLFSGLALSIERPFKIGDWIRLSDGTEGQVEDINWRATHLRGWDKTTFIIPNGTLARESFTNLHGQNHVYSPWYTVKVSGDYDPKKVVHLLEKAAGRCVTPLKSPSPVVRLMDGKNTPYTYMVWVHFENYPTMFAGREELYREIDSNLRNAGIPIASKIQEIRYRKIDDVHGLGVAQNTSAGEP